MPNHMKIDVDGNEIMVLQGARNVLKSSGFKSLLIEMDEADSKIMNELESCGLRLAEKRTVAMQGDADNMVNAVFKRI